jgi:hypothetical protein
LRLWSVGNRSIEEEVGQEVDYEGDQRHVGAKNSVTKIFARYLFGNPSRANVA